mgnify:CR=1 FL=1
MPQGCYQLIISILFTVYTFSVFVDTNIQDTLCWQQNEDYVYKMVDFVLYIWIV